MNTRERLLKAKANMRSASLFHFGFPTLRPWDMMGDAGKQFRAATMEALEGKRMPIAKCGVNAISAKLASMLGCENNEEAIEKALEAIK